MNNCIITTGPGRRRGEPVTCGIPWERGRLSGTDCLALHTERGKSVPLQARAIDRWPDGSIRWTLLDWQTVEATGSYVVSDSSTPVGLGIPMARMAGGTVRVDTGRVHFEMRAGEDLPLMSTGERNGGVTLMIDVQDEQGRPCQSRIDELNIEEDGPIRSSVRAAGSLTAPGGSQLAELAVVAHFFAESSTVRVELTIINPRRSGHPGNLWNLGDLGSIYLGDASVRINLPGSGGQATLRCSPEPGIPSADFAVPFELYQDSSGGENWRSTNHVNRSRVVPNRFRGYRIGGEAGRGGLRATPVVELIGGGGRVALAMEHFWQNFPKAIDSDGRSIILRLFPRQYADVHELQGGEQKTHKFYADFGGEEVTDTSLEWCRGPARPHAEPAWYCGSGAIPMLIARDEDASPEYLALVDSAVSGGDSFVRKREVIDEYGWRNFGEIYADHEAVFRGNQAPLVSHYNNQYDAVAGLAYHFLRSGDPQWWTAMDELACHVYDIDIYHSKSDKNAYNGGLFWHTCHYIDAGTCTHRTYPRSLGVQGGGPSGGHLYTTGMLLHYFLTGDNRSRDAAIGLARYVIDADDGRRTVFRWLDRGPTGHTTASATFDYHGPGRGSGNSLNALIDGHQLTGNPTYLLKAEEVVRRCIHPRDDIEAREFADVENKWFYTMFLQALGRYLDHKASLGQVDWMYAYARSALLLYARWMAEHEYPYLDRPEILEYPTETWSAQDMRKCEVFGLAAKHAEGEERARFLERCEFFFRDAVTKLSSMPTRTLARPVVLLLSNGLIRGYLQLHPEAKSPAPMGPLPDFGEPTKFVPQRARAIRKAKALAVAGLVVGLAAGLGAVVLWPR